MIGNREIFRNTSHSMLLGSPSIMADLEKVFGLTRKELKWYLKSWIRKQNRNFDFNEWWTPPIIRFLLPIDFTPKRGIAERYGKTAIN